MTRGLALIDYTPVLADARFVECMAGRAYEDDPLEAARPFQPVRLRGPELRHTAGGTSGATCVAAGESYRELRGSGRTRAPNGMRACKGCGCQFQPKTSRQIFHEVPCANAYFRRQDREKHRKAAARRREAQAGRARA